MLELLVLLAAASPEAAQAPVQMAQAVDAARCQRLASYYDRYAQRGQGSTFAGGFDRAVGADKCNAGDIQGGVVLLERAIVALGFSPPK